MQIAILPSDLAAAEAAAREATSGANDAASNDNTEADHQQYWIDNADSRAQVGAAAAQLVADTPQAVANARAQSGPGAIGLTGLALDNFDRDFQQRSDALPEAARPAFAQLVKPYRDTIGARAVSTEAADRLAWRAGAYTQSADQWGEAVARDPALLPAAVGALRDTLPHLDPGQTDTLAEYARKQVVQGGVAAGLAQDPAALHEALSRATRDEGGAPDHPLVALMTPTERAHYLEAARIGVLAQQTMQREQTRALAAQAGPQLLATGQADNVPTRAQLVAHLGEEEGARVADSLQMDAATGSARRLIVPLSEAEFARLEAQPAAAGAQGAQDREALLRAIALERKAREANPVDYAQRSGLYGIAPIADFNDAPALAAELNRRSLASGSIARDYGTAPAVLSNAELAQLADTLKGQKPDQQQGLLRNLGTGLADGELTQSVLRGLSVREPVIALAGHFMADKNTDNAPPQSWGGNGKLDVPAMLLQGNARLRPTADSQDAQQKNAPSLHEMSHAFDLLTGGMYADKPGEEAMRVEGARALYTVLQPDSGPNAPLDPGITRAAVKLAVKGNLTPREAGLNEWNDPRTLAAIDAMHLDPRVYSTADNPYGLSAEDLQKANLYRGSKADVFNHNGVLSSDLTPAMRQHIQAMDAKDAADVMADAVLKKSQTGAPSMTPWNKNKDKQAEIARDLRTQTIDAMLGSPLASALTGAKIALNDGTLESSAPMAKAAQAAEGIASINLPKAQAKSSVPAASKADRTNRLRITPTESSTPSAQLPNNKFDQAAPDGKSNISAEVAKDGAVEFAIEAKQGAAIPGRELFKGMIEHYRAGGGDIKAIRGSWTNLESSDRNKNLKKVNELTAEGVPLDEAVHQTWTSQEAKKYGFDNVHVELAEGSPGKYTKVQVLISKKSGTNKE